MVGQAAIAVRLDARSISHHMGDVALFLDPVEEMRHGAFGEDGHVLHAVGLRVQRDGSLLPVVVDR